MKQIYKLSDENGNVIKEVEYEGDQKLFDQLTAFQTVHGIKFGDNLHDALVDVSNYLMNKGAKYV